MECTGGCGSQRNYGSSRCHCSCQGILLKMDLSKTWMILCMKYFDNYCCMILLRNKEVLVSWWFKKSCSGNQYELSASWQANICSQRKFLIPCFSYASSSKYARVLNVPFPKYKKVPFPKNLRSFLRKNIRIFPGKNYEGWGRKVRKVAAYYTINSVFDFLIIWEKKIKKLDSRRNRFIGKCISRPGRK